MQTTLPKETTFQIPATESIMPSGTLIKEIFPSCCTTKKFSHHMQHLIRVYTVCHSSSNILDTSTGSSRMDLPLKHQSQLLSSALSSACDFKSHFCKQCGPRYRYTKIGLKSLQGYSADDINRRHFQMQFFLAL